MSIPQNAQAPHQSPRRLTGGGSAAAEAVSDNRGHFGYFKHGIDTIRGGDSLLQSWVRILPAHNPDISVEDASWKTSVAPYRDVKSGRLDSSTQTPAFASFFSVIQTYAFLGRSQESIISPATLASMGSPGMFQPMDVADPIQDMRNAARSSGDAFWISLTEEPQPPPGQPKPKNAKATIPWTRAQAVMNLLVYANNTFAQGLHTFSLTGVEFLKAELSWLLTHGSAPRDPSWPMYQLGDVTCPKYGAFGRVTKKTSPGNATVKSLTISYAERQGAPCFNPATMELPAEIMAKRYDLLDCDKVLNIPSYQEILDWAVQDGAFPIELIQYACANKADVKAPKGPAFAAAATGFPGQAGGYNAPQMGGMMPPPMGAVGGATASGFPQMGAPQMGGMMSPPQMGAPQMLGAMGGFPQMGAPQMGVVAGAAGGLPQMGGPQMGSFPISSVDEEDDVVMGATPENGGWSNPPPAAPMFNPPTLPGGAPPVPQQVALPVSKTAATDALPFFVLLVGTSAAQPNTVIGASLASLPQDAKVACATPGVTNGWVSPSELGYHTAAPVQVAPPVPQAQVAPPVVQQVQTPPPVMQPAMVAPQAQPASQIPTMVVTPPNAEGPLNQEEMTWFKATNDGIQNGTVVDAASVERWSILRQRAVDAGQTLPA